MILTETAGTSDPSGLDLAPLKRIHIVATAAILGGAALDGYVLGIIGPSLALASTEMQLSSLNQGLIAASALIGVFIGGLIFGNLADRYGRRPVFAWNLAAFVVLSLLQYLVQDMWQLVVLRLALGLAIGVEYAVGTAVLAEFSRRRGRGVLLGSFALAWQIGFSVAFFVGMAYEGDNWRLLLASSAIPAAITFLLRLGLPESPMWLKARGREQEAEDIVRRHFGTGYTIPTIALEETHPSPVELFRHPNWRAHLYAGLFWFCQIGPFFAIFTFALPVFKSLGMESGLTVDILLNGLQILGAVFGLWLLHWLTRRSFVISTFAIMFVLLLGLGLLPDAPTWLVVSLFAGYMFIAPAANNMQFVYPSEIFETRIRSTGVGFAAAFSRISAAAATYLLPVAMQEYGVSATLLIMAAFPLVGLVVSLVWAPETKRAQLR